MFSVAVHVCTLVHPSDSVNVNIVFADRPEQLTYLQDVTALIKRVNEIFIELYRFWRNEHILMKTKIYTYLFIYLFNSNVKMVLLCGCEIWAVTTQITNKVQTFVNLMFAKNNAHKIA